MPKFSMGRRRFTAAAAAAAATALIHPAEALAQPEPLPEPRQAATPLQQQAQTAMAKLTPQSQAEVEMKVNNIFRKYGDRLSDEQKADIRRIMAEGQDGLEKMRAFVVENDDQPATVFHPYRGESHHQEGHRQEGNRSEGKK